MFCELGAVEQNQRALGERHKSIICSFLCEEHDDDNFGYWEAYWEALQPPKVGKIDKKHKNWHKFQYTGFIYSVLNVLKV